MKEVTAKTDKVLFPLSMQYDENWIKKNSLGENVLYNLESLCEVLEFKEGMRVLDLGCGKAVSAIFLAREFGVQVWAVDHNINASENYERIKEMNCEHNVFPLKMNAHKLPFPQEFFDAIIVVDSYMYFGANEKFTPYISGFLKTGGYIGVVDFCFSKEINYLAEVPDFMKADYQQKWYFVHSLEWWTRLWDKTGLLRIKTAEVVPGNEFIRLAYVRDFENSRKKDSIAEALKKDENKLINIFRLTAQRTEKSILNQ